MAAEKDTSVQTEYARAREEAVEAARVFLWLCDEPDTTPKDVVAHAGALALAAGRAAGVATRLRMAK